MRLQLTLALCTFILGFVSYALPHNGTLAASNITIPPPFADVVRSGLDYLSKRGKTHTLINIIQIKVSPRTGHNGLEATDFTDMSILIDQPDIVTYVRTQNVPEHPLTFQGAKTILHRDAEESLIFRYPFAIRDIQKKTMETAFKEASEVLRPPYDSMVVELYDYNFFWHCYGGPVIYRFQKRDPNDWGEAIVGTTCGGAIRVGLAGLPSNTTGGVSQLASGLPGTS